MGIHRVPVSRAGTAGWRDARPILTSTPPPWLSDTVMGADAMQSPQLCFSAPPPSWSAPSPAEKTEGSTERLQAGAHSLLYHLPPHLMQVRDRD